MSTSFLRKRKVDFAGAISGSLADGTCGVDLKGRFTFVDHRAEKLLGWSEDKKAQEIASFDPIYRTVP